MSGRLPLTRLSPLARVRQVRRLMRDGGAGALASRVRLTAAAHLAPPGTRGLPIPVETFARLGEVADAPLLPPLPLEPDGRLSIAWVCVPPGPASGGHTTLFRLIAGLERSGHRCTVYLADRHGWDLERHTSTIRDWWPEVRAEIRDLSHGIDDSHAVVATGWETAYAVRVSEALGTRFYLVQDYEPMFSAAGSEQLLAAASYDFGFHGITAGPWLAEKLRADHGMPADPFEFGCDTATYRRADRESASGRKGVVYYCRPETPRRAHELAVVALELFTHAHPEVPIHLFGTPVASLPFQATQHGELRPAELARLYQACVAGLVLSATNISLVPLEMLAAGCIPVVNDAAHNRAVLGNPYVAWANPTPHELAAALAGVVSRPSPGREDQSRSAADSVASVSWGDAERRVAEVIVETVTRAARTQQGSAVGADPPD